MSFRCPQAFQNLPATCKDGNGLLLPRGLVLTTLGQQFATAIVAGAQTNWNTDIVAYKLFPYHKIKEVEDLSAEFTNWESASGDIVPLFEGKIRMKFTFYLTVEQHQALRSATGKTGNVYFYDRVGNIMCTSPDGTIRKGFSMSYVNVQTLKPGTADTPALSVLEIQLEDPTEFNETLRVIEPYTGAGTSWYPANLPVITKTVITQVGSIVADVVTFDVEYQSLSVTGNLGIAVTKTGVEGLDVTTFTNFKFTVSGVVTAPSAMTEVSGLEGRYTATVTSIATSDTIEILPVATDDFLYTSDPTAVTT